MSRNLISFWNRVDNQILTDSYQIAVKENLNPEGVISNSKAIYMTGKKWFGFIEKWYSIQNFCEEIPMLF